MVTALEVIENTPMVVTADDAGCIKIWDIRSLKCLQTVDRNEKTMITKLISFYEQGSIVYTGRRVNVIEFDLRSLALKKNLQEYQYPIRVEFDPVKFDLIVCTRKEVKYYNLQTGRMKYSFIGLLDDTQEDDITVFKSIEQNNKFIIGNQKGTLQEYLAASGEKTKLLLGHQNEITQIQMDYQNQLLTTSGWDGSVKIQRMAVGQTHEKQKEVLREIKNCFADSRNPNGRPI